MQCVRCGGNGYRPDSEAMPSSDVASSFEEPDNGMAYMCYSEFDAGLVCSNCMRSALLRCDSVSSSDSDQPTRDQDLINSLKL